jgi:hypothetical protein
MGAVSSPPKRLHGVWWDSFSCSRGYYLGKVYGREASRALPFVSRKSGVALKHQGFAFALLASQVVEGRFQWRVCCGEFAQLCCTDDGALHKWVW